MAVLTKDAMSVVNERDGSRLKSSRFVLGIFSFITAGFGLLALRAYGILHWKIIRNHYGELGGGLKDDLFSLLSLVELIQRGLGVFVFVVTVICFVKREAIWSRMLAAAAMLVSLLLIFSIQ